VTPTEFDRLLSGADVIAREGPVPRVARLADGSFIKIFRRKGPWSSATIRSYARRFADATAALAARDVVTVEVTEVFRVTSLQREAVQYRPLEGESLRALVEADRCEPATIDSFARFVATLHDRGIYFRGLHFGNVLVCADGSFGLIDVSDTTIARRPLRPGHRARNFRPMLRYPEGRSAIASFGPDRFVEAYLDAAELPVEARRRFLHRLRSIHELFATLADSPST
jgi:hypothetical protein